MNLKETNALAKKLGNDYARFYASDNDVSEKEARRCPLKAIHEEFKEIIKRGQLPENTSVKPFRTGWRGAYIVNHGTPSAYSQGCRCDECKECWRVYQAKRRHNRRLRVTLQLRAATALAISDDERANSVFASTEWIQSMNLDEHFRFKAENLSAKQLMNLLAKKVEQ